MNMDSFPGQYSWSVRLHEESVNSSEDKLGQGEGGRGKGGGGEGGMHFCVSDVATNFVEQKGIINSHNCGEHDTKLLVN